MAIINGTAGDDTLTGTSAADTISGLGGNDTITDTLGGADLIHGDDGDDVITVSRTVLTGGVNVYGDAGADILRLTGVTGNFFGGDGDDQIYLLGGAQGNIDLGAGNDVLIRSGSIIDPSMSVTTGAGQDAVAGSALIEDFTVGNAGDRLLWNEALAQMNTWDQSTNPFASGHMRLVQLGTTASVQIFNGDWRNLRLSSQRPDRRPHDVQPRGLRRRRLGTGEPEPDRHRRRRHADR